MDVDLRLVLQFDGDCKSLMRDFLAGPPPLGEDYKVVIIALAVDVSRHLECRGLKRACTANIARRSKPHLALPGRSSNLFSSFPR